MTLSREERRARRVTKRPTWISARADELEQDLRILAPIARRKARAAGPLAGVHVGHLKRYLLQHPEILLASSLPRYRAALFSLVMQRAGLAKTGRKIHTLRMFGGNEVCEWTLPEWATERARRSTRRAA
jgi:hypothetical protein